jgi:hypothetical protein
MADRSAGTHMQHARLMESKIGRVESNATAPTAWAMFTAILRASSRVSNKVTFMAGN